MSEEVTKLYLNVAMYDVFENEIFEAIIPVSHIELDFYNDEFDGCNDIKKIKFKGKIENTSQGSILLGSI